jgi:hypothetical protein
MATVHDCNPSGSKCVTQVQNRMAYYFGIDHVPMTLVHPLHWQGCRWSSKPQLLPLQLAPQNYNYFLTPPPPNLDPVPHLSNHHGLTEEGPPQDHRTSPPPEHAALIGYIKLQAGQAVAWRV